MKSRAFLLSIRASFLAVLLAVALPAAAQVTRVAGTVLDEAGEPVKGATVRAENQDGPLQMRTSVTDEDGRFLFIVQRSGIWTFTIEAPGFAPTVGKATLRVATAQPPPVEVRLERREAPEAVGVLAGVDTKVVATQLESADALFAAGQYDEAIAAYRKIKTQTPALTIVGLQLGDAYLQKKNYDLAEAEFNEVLKSNPGNANASYNLGEINTARGKIDEAVAWYQKATDADVLWARPLLRLAVIARDQGNVQAAVSYLKKVIELDPSSTEGSQATALLGLLGPVN